MSRQKRRVYAQPPSSGDVAATGCALVIGWGIGLIVTWGLVALVVVGVLKLFGVV